MTATTLTGDDIGAQAAEAFRYLLSKYDPESHPALVHEMALMFITVVITTKAHLADGGDPRVVGKIVESGLDYFGVSFKVETVTVQ